MSSPQPSSGAFAIRDVNIVRSVRRDDLCLRGLARISGLFVAMNRRECDTSFLGKVAN
ncbi:hypothetical protein NKH55_15940 [Mesorhizobium opportunistum]|uniref:hypothetical protein n=1 Tax=Mesorhizobium opportunistum TaxID=593909 RepID=UPI00333CD385